MAWAELPKVPRAKHVEWQRRELNRRATRNGGRVGLSVWHQRPSAMLLGGPRMGLRVRLLALADERRRFSYRRLYILLARQAGRPKTSAWHAIADDLAEGPEPALVARLCVRRPWQWTAVPGTGIRRRLYRECLGFVVDTSLSGLRVGRELDRIAGSRGYPATTVSDNGTELTSHAILR